MIRQWLYRFTANRPCRLIKQPNGKPYLERYFLFSVFGWTCYLHRFVGSDGDRSLHNHPWHIAISIVLCGWYDEWKGTEIHRLKTPITHMQLVTLEGRPRLRWVRWINVITQRTYHQIARVEPETWTLFIHSDWIARWGFLEPMAGAENRDRYIHTDYPGSFKKDKNWWLTAPIGNRADREPFNQ